MLWWFRDRLGQGLDWDSSFLQIGADSLDLVELVMEVEERFGIMLADDDSEQINTVADAIRILRKYLPGEAA